LRGPRGGESAGRVAPAVLEALGHLDPGRYRQRTAARGKIPPSVEGFLMAADPSEQSGPVSEETLALQTVRPGRCVGLVRAQ
jgi:hypothetical protein